MLKQMQLHKGKKKVSEMKSLLDRYENDGYNVVRVDISKLIWSVFDKNFKEGDEIYWLGHDWVFGFMHGEKFTADKQAVEKKEALQFWNKVDELNFEPYKNHLITNIN